MPPGLRVVDVAASRRRSRFLHTETVIIFEPSEVINIRVVN
jgi:hypothetical protein